MACTPTSRYQQKKDTVPSRVPTLLEQQDAIPRVETKSRGGNKNYTVRGKNYTVLNTAQGYKEEGIASFYGEKFHGHLTSNGEIYNMFSMTAAHKSLPLPTYVKVTNLDNQKIAIVRVNDRGPFHPGRIIDLSYSAAYKLGISGIANVSVETIDVQEKPPILLNSNASSLIEKSTVVTPKNELNESSIVSTSIIKEAAPIILQEQQKVAFIQVFVTSDVNNADNIKSSLEKQFSQPVLIQNKNTLYHVLIGPLSVKVERSTLLQQLKSVGYSGAFNKEVTLP